MPGANLVSRKMKPGRLADCPGSKTVASRGKENQESLEDQQRKQRSELTKGCSVEPEDVPRDIRMN